MRFPVTAKRVYVALGALTVLSIVLTAWQLDQKWAHEWMPNFIAEWSGLFVAVVVIERLLARARAVEEQTRRAPLRHLAGERLKKALTPLLDLAVEEYCAAGADLDSGEPAAVFFTRWSVTLTKSKSARSARWLRELDDVFASTCKSLEEFRSEYASAIDPGELAHIDVLSRELWGNRGTLVHARQSVDPSFAWPDDILTTPRWTPQQAANAASSTCTDVAPYFSATARVCEGMTGVTLTTGAGYALGSVRFRRRIAEFSSSP